MRRSGLTLAPVLILMPLQIVVGDLHGLDTLRTQAQKITANRRGSQRITAIEGIWQTGQGVPLLLFALPDEATRSNRVHISVPG